MKVCPTCFLQYEDDESFCFNDGTVLNFLATSLETVMRPVVSTQAVNCRKCSNENAADAKFCKNCGITLTTSNNLIHIPLIAPAEQQETVVIQTTKKPEPQTFPAFQVSNQSGSLQSDHTGKYILGGIGVLMVLIFAGVFLYPANKSKEAAVNSNNKSTASNAEARETGSNSNPVISPLIGKTGYLQMNANLRTCPDYGCPSVGIHFENAKLKILEVQEKVKGVIWYKVQISDYGCHTLNKTWCGKQISLDKYDSGRTSPLESDKNAQDVGWVISYSKDVRRDVVRY